MHVWRSTEICPLLFCSSDSAVCNQTCLNGGTCSQPDNYTCVTRWNGTTCSEGLWNVFRMHLYLHTCTYTHMHKGQSPKETLLVTVHHSTAPQPPTHSFRLLYFNGLLSTCLAYRIHPQCPCYKHTITIATSPDISLVLPAFGCCTHSSLCNLCWWCFSDTN